MKNKNNSIIMLRIAFLKIMCYTTLAFIKALFVPLGQWIEQGPPKGQLCLTLSIKNAYIRQFYTTRQNQHKKNVKIL